MLSCLYRRAKPKTTISYFTSKQSGAIVSNITLSVRGSTSDIENLTSINVDLRTERVKYV